jgi:hypothetical protein
MEYLEGSSLDLECVEIHDKSLKAIKDQFENDEEANAYMYIIEFGLSFALYAKAALASSSVDKTIKTLNKEIGTMVCETSKFEKIVEFYADQSAQQYYTQPRSNLSAPAFVAQKPTPA